MSANIFEFFKNLMDKNTAKLIYGPISSDHVDNKKDYHNLIQGQHYIRLYLVEMYLKKQVQYLQSWFPAVHSLARFEFAGKPVEVPNVADSTRIAAKKFDSGDIIARNYEMTPLIPYNSGTIQFSAGLVGVKGINFLNNFIQTLSEFSKLLSVPQFSTSIQVAGPLAMGLQSLLGSGELHLGMHDTYGPSKQGGYYVALRVPDQTINRDCLRVIKDQLYIEQDGVTKPFDQCDYMLFRIELTKERNDWENLTEIQTAIRKAHLALEEGDEQLADSYYRKATIAAREAPEFTTSDRTRVMDLIRGDRMKMQRSLAFYGLTGEEEFDLAKAMQTAISVEEAAKRGEPSFTELFG